MSSIWREFRILLAEWLLRRAMRTMPADAPEARLMVAATDRYFEEADRLARWVKFPA